MKATVVLVVVNVAVYVAMLIVGEGGLQAFSQKTLLDFGANYSKYVFDRDEVWRLLTATMIHLNLAHIAMNMVALVQVGRSLEPRWGTARFLLAYFVTGVAGSVASAVWFSGTKTVAAGASGAICGLIGAAIVAFHLARGPGGRNRRNAMATWAGLTLVAGHFAGADDAAHAGGLVAGLVLALPVEKMGIRRHGGPAVQWGSILAFLALAGGAFAVALAN